MRGQALLAGMIGSLALLIPTTGSSAAGFYNGNRLWTACGSTTDGEPPDICTSYVMGAVDSVLSAQDAGAMAKRICLPAQISGGQLADVVRRYLSEHPEARHYTAASVLWTSLNRAFPCPPNPAQ